MQNILEVKDLRISFKRDNFWHEVVKGISFSLKKGETLGIVGESGSGKSVTCLAIMDLLEKRNTKISENSIFFHGSKKAMIFQEPMTALNPVMRCGRQVMEVGVSKERCLELFNEVLLPNPERIFSSYPHQLSGGQRQRVMIAMALASKPDILIADEPTTALDVSVQKAVLDLMKVLQRKYNIGIIFITHDLGVVNQIADRVAVIYKGEIVPAQHPYTKGLIASRPPMDKRPKRLSTVSDFMNEDYVQPPVICASERLKLHNMIYSQTPLLSVKHLNVRYGKFTAIEDISFDVYRGETLGLVGESGCGKSTLGASIMNLIEQMKGEICFEGREISNLKKGELKKLRKDIQIVFQNPYSSLNPRLTIGKAIEEVLVVHKIEKDKVKRREMVMQMLEKVGLEREHFDRYPHEFSGGQRQRIGIARALILNPRIVICDECVSALDVSVQAQVLNLLNDLKRDLGLTFIFISHDLAVVKYMSDRMMVMRKGAIEQLGEADEIYANPQTEYTQRLINSIPK